MQSFVVYPLQQLFYQSPLLLVCVVGIILALVYKQLGLPAILLGTGCGLILLTLLLGALSQAYLSQYYAADWIGYALAGVGLLTAVSKAAGTAFIIAAALAGRARSE